MPTGPSPDPLWYKDAAIYQLHVKAFFDSNDDGVGDFRGLTMKLDYLKDLGVTALWLLPFYPSPLRDDGYDIADYRGIHPSYGTMADFREFVRQAHRRGLKVITELVINHTSDRHPWFQRARRAPPGSHARRFYVWSEVDTRYAGTRIIFLDTEKSNWAWDPEAKAYYWHRFYSHQPDLNFDNPAVVRAVISVMRYWLDTGVDGLRLDAVPYLCEREGTINENLPETHAILKRLRAEIDRRYAAKMLLAEANQWPEDVLPYFGDGDECHMAFHFPLMPRLYMALAQEDRHPITDIMRQTPDIPAPAQWAIFLRNHDELTLEMVTDRERDYLWNFYARDPRARLNLGIRRRLSPLMENDRRRIDLLNSLLLSMPGTPVLYYGDEIGMGDNVYLGDRDGVRTPMQWSPDRNGGFSRADPARLYLPPIMDPVYGYASVNVESQSRLSSSPLQQMRRFLSIRSSRRAFGRGTVTFLYPANRKVLAYVRQHEDEIILCVANLARSSQPVELELGPYKGRVPVDLFDRSHFPPVAERPYSLTLPGHAFFWFVLLDPAQVDGGVEPAEPEPQPEFVTLVIRTGWPDLRAGRASADLRREALPRFLATQRWAGLRDGPTREVRPVAGSDLPPAGGSGGDGWRVAIIEADLASGATQRYLIPAGFAWATQSADALVTLLPITIARVRRFRVEGALIDAATQDGFAAAVIDAVRRNFETAADPPAAGVVPVSAESAPGKLPGRIRYLATEAMAGLKLPENAHTRRAGPDRTTTTLFVENAAVLKLYRRLEPGIRAEIEMLGYLTRTAPAVAAPSLLGTMEWLPAAATEAGGESYALGLLLSFVPNQGDLWSYTRDHLQRSFQDSLHAPPPGAAADQADKGNLHHALYMEIAGQVGTRTAELHRAFCRTEEGDPAFRPEEIGEEDIALWKREIVSQAETVFVQLRDWTVSGRGADTAAIEQARALLDQGPSLPSRLHGLDATLGAAKTRYHGDLHLGQVLLKQNDVVVVEFGGEPNRPLSERRRKHTPLKDVARLLRSFHYASAAAARTVAELPAIQLADFQAFCTDWHERAVTRFLGRYRETLGESPILPKDPAKLEALLNTLMLDQAIYEIGFELANRPAWVGIPVKAALDLLAAIPAA